MNKKLSIIAVAVLAASILAPVGQASAAKASARGIDVAVAAYVWPGDPYLTDMIDPVKTPVPPAVVVVNIGNGEGDVSVMDQTADALRARKAANGEHVKVIGYVYSQHTARDINAVKSNIDNWLAVRGGAVHYDGIFVDETTRTCGAVAGGTEYRDYYRALREYVWEKLPNTEDLVINNPGTAVEDCMLEASQRTADTYVTFEGDYATYNQDASAATGWSGYAGGNVFNLATGYRAGTDFDSNSFWHLVYNTPSANMKAAVSLAYNRYAGNVGITDDLMTSTWVNPWDQKPSYLPAETKFASRI